MTSTCNENMGMHQRNFSLPLVFLLLAILASQCSGTKSSGYQITKNYRPDDPDLYDTIVKLDSIFFDAYNTCDRNLAKYAAFYAEDLEFYHDQGGLSTSKADVVEGTRQNICGRVTRELVPGSIEVYPIPGFGAIEYGLHKFHNNQQPPGTPAKVGRFTAVWRHDPDGWKLARVISLH